MEQAAEQVTSRMDMGKDYVVEAVSGVAQALRQTGQQLRQEGSQTTLAGYVDRGAEQIETFGGYLRGRDSSQIITDVEGFARRQPLAFAGSAFALGMLAVRFFPDRESDHAPDSDISGIDTVWRGLIWQRLAHAVFCLSAYDSWHDARFHRADAQNLHRDGAGRFESHVARSAADLTG